MLRSDELACQHRPDSDARGRLRQHTVVRMTLWLSPNWQRKPNRIGAVGRRCPTCGSAQLSSASWPLTEIPSRHSGASSSFSAGGITHGAARCTGAGRCDAVQSSGVAGPRHLHPSIPPPSLPRSPPPPRHACVSAPNANELLSLQRLPHSPPLLSEISEDENSEPHCLMTMKLHWFNASDEVSFIWGENKK